MVKAICISSYLVWLGQLVLATMHIDDLCDGCSQDEAGNGTSETLSNRSPFARWIVGQTSLEQLPRPCPTHGSWNLPKFRVQKLHTIEHVRSHHGYAVVSQKVVTLGEHLDHILELKLKIPNLCRCLHIHCKIFDQRITTSCDHTMM